MNVWKDLVVDGDADRTVVRHLASFAHVENSYTFRLTDGVNTYEEKQESTEILNRCSTLNPSVDYATLGDLFRDIHKFLFTKSGRVEIEKSEDLIRLKVSGKVYANTSFHWTFNLEKDVLGILTRELLKAASRLIAENEHLKKALRGKDLHILDLEGSGATLSRRTLKTKPFDESDLKTIPIASIEPETALDILTSEQYKELQERISLSSTPLEQDVSASNDLHKKANKKGMKRGILFHDDTEDTQDCTATPIKKMREIPKETTSSFKRKIQKKDAAAKKLKKL